MKTGFLHTTLTIIRKDLLAELRSRELSAAMLLFALLSVLIFSFALELDRVAREEAVSGVLWVTVVFASILGLNRSMAIEREHSTMDALLLAPIDRSAIFMGKFLGNFIFTMVMGLLLLPLMTILYNMPLVDPWVLVVLILGICGISASGTLLAAMTVQTRAREALLPIAMLPIVLPVVLAAVRASTAIVADAPMADWISWPQILVIIDVIFIVVCFLSFSFVIEE